MIHNAKKKFTPNLLFHDFEYIPCAGSVTFNAIQQTILVEESLALGLLGGHLKVYLGHAFHEIGSLARALVESFPVSGMPGGHGSIVVLLLGEKGTDEQSDQDDNRPWVKKTKRILHEMARVQW